MVYVRMQDQRSAATNFSRRQLLRVTGATTVGGVITTMSGCLGDDDDDNGNGNGGDPEELGERVEEVHFVTWTQSGSPDVFEASRIISSELEALGLEVDLDPQEFPQPIISTLFDEREFDISMIGYVGEPSRLDPSFWVNTSLHSDQIPAGGWNFPGYDNPDFDQLSEEQQRELDVDRRQELVYELQETAFDDAAWTIYVSPDMPIGINADQLNRPEDIVPGAGLLGVRSLTTIAGVDGNDTLHLTYLREEIDTLNPLRITEAEAHQFIRPIYDTLVAVDAEGRPEGWMLEDLTVEDETTVVATLLDGLRFHDGEPVTADDVAFSFDFLAEHEAAYYAPEIDPVEDITVENDRTVTFHLAQPHAPFQMLTLARVPILPEHFWSTLTDDEDIDSPREYLNEPAIGSGPFAFERHNQGQLLELSAFDEHPHAPSIETLRIQLFGSEAVAAEAVSSGDANGIWDMTAPVQNDLEAADAVDFFTTPNHRVVTLSQNARRGMPFSDIAFRRAVEHAIPNDIIIQDVYNGHGSPGGSVISDANEFWHNPEVGYREYDHDQARSILEDAGYGWDDDDRLHLPPE